MLRKTLIGRRAFGSSWTARVLTEGSAVEMTFSCEDLALKLIDAFPIRYVHFLPTKRSMTVLPINEQPLVRLYMTEVVRIVESLLQAFDARHSQLDNAIIIQRALPAECCLY